MNVKIHQQKYNYLKWKYKYWMVHKLLLYNKFEHKVCNANGDKTIHIT